MSGALLSSEDFQCIAWRDAQLGGAQDSGVHPGRGDLSCTREGMSL